MAIGWQPPHPAAGRTARRLTAALFPDDPANVHHSYISDAVKFSNTHIGKEQHVFHLHNHQWLYNPKTTTATTSTPRA